MFKTNHFATLREVIPHPLLFGIFPALFTAASFSCEVLPEQLILPAVVGAFFAGLLYLILFLFMRDNAKAALTASMVVLVFNFYPASKMAVSALPANEFRGWAALFLYLLGGTICLGAVASVKNSQRFTTHLNFMAVALLLYSCGNLAVHEMAARSIYGPILETASRECAAMHATKKERPDIYYIIVDAMACPRIMHNVLGYDNSAYINTLERKGFTVSSASRSNYQMTVLSLASSTNMQYLDQLQPALGSQYDHTVPYRMIQNSRIAMFLKDQGYRFINVSSGWFPTEWIPIADANVGPAWGGAFQVALAQQSLLGLLQDNFDMLGSLCRSKRTNLFDNADGIAAQSGPKFVFAHILLPHPPYLFDAQGRPLRSNLALADRFDQSLYLGQAKFAESEVLKLVEKLQSNPARMPVIIIQSDHGPGACEGDGPVPSREYLDRRMHNFCACYFPGVDAGSELAQITPVNLFRLVFNKYFATGLPMLSDRCIYSTPDHPYLYRDVTTLVPPLPGSASVAPVYTARQPRDAARRHQAGSLTHERSSL